MAFSADSSYAKGGELIGAPVWRSPEVFLNISWGPPTDIWSFGTMVNRSSNASLTFLQVLTVLSWYRSSVLSSEATMISSTLPMMAFPTITRGTSSRFSSSNLSSSDPSKIHTRSCWIGNELMRWQVLRKSCRRNGLIVKQMYGLCPIRLAVFYQKIMLSSLEL